MSDQDAPKTEPIEKTIAWTFNIQGDIQYQVGHRSADTGWNFVPDHADPNAIRLTITTDEPGQPLTLQLDRSNAHYFVQKAHEKLPGDEVLRAFVQMIEAKGDLLPVLNVVPRAEVSAPSLSEVVHPNDFHAKEIAAEFSRSTASAAVHTLQTVPQPSAAWKRLDKIEKTLTQLVNDPCVDAYRKASELPGMPARALAMYGDNILRQNPGFYTNYQQAGDLLKDLKKNLKMNDLSDPEISRKYADIQEVMKRMPDMENGLSSGLVETAHALPRMKM